MSVIYTQTYEQGMSQGGPGKTHTDRDTGAVSFRPKNGRSLEKAQRVIAGAVRASGAAFSLGYWLNGYPSANKALAQFRAGLLESVGKTSDQPFTVENEKALAAHVLGHIAENAPSKGDMAEFVRALEVDAIADFDLSVEVVAEESATEETEPEAV